MSSLIGEGAPCDPGVSSLQIISYIITMGKGINYSKEEASIEDLLLEEEDLMRKRKMGDTAASQKSKLEPPAKKLDSASKESKEKPTSKSDADIVEAELAAEVEFEYKNVEVLSNFTADKASKEMRKHKLVHKTHKQSLIMLARVLAVSSASSASSMVPNFFESSWTTRQQHHPSGRISSFYMLPDGS